MSSAKGIKTKYIKLSHGHRNPDTGPGEDLLYRVEQVQNSVEYVPLQLVHKSAVEELCASKYWQVTIVSVPNR